MDVDISRDGFIHHDRYEKGVPVVELENGLLPTIGKTKKTGTRINFLPDPEIFEKTRFKEEDVKNRLKETAYLNPSLQSYTRTNEAMRQSILSIMSLRVLSVL